MPVAIGASLKQSSFSIYAARKKTIKDTMIKITVWTGVIRPVGIALSFVRGFKASILQSISLFKNMAAERAPTIATIIQRILSNEGIPLADSIAPIKANGRANRVWENFIISSIIRVFSRILIIKEKITQNKEKGKGKKRKKFSLRG